MFIYKELSQAESDLRLFSDMNKNEDRLLFLICGPEGMHISQQLGLTVEKIPLITAIAINGFMFYRKD